MQQLATAAGAGLKQHVKALGLPVIAVLGDGKVRLLQQKAIDAHRCSCVFFFFYNHANGGICRRGLPLGTARSLTLFIYIFLLCAHL